MSKISFDDPNPNRVENAILGMFESFTAELNRRNSEWKSECRWNLESLQFAMPREVVRSVVTLEVRCCRKCCTGFGGAPDHLVHSLSVYSEFGICAKYPKYWRIDGHIGNFDPELDETPIAGFLEEVQYDEEQPDAVYLEEVRRKLSAIPDVLQYVSPDTTRWTKREY